MKKNTKNLTVIALMIAMTTVATIVIQIPIPATKGYFNLGDTILLTSALLFGRYAGAITGGVGSMLADLLLGYAYYAPVTLIVKGLEGFICGFIFEKSQKESPLLAALIAGIFMAFGYFAYETVLYGVAVAVGSLFINLGQGILGAIVAYFLFKAVKSTGIIEKLQQ